jgi:chaperonin GroEL
LQGAPARAALLLGMQQMTDLLRPTLGPMARTVAIDRLVGSRGPEILDSGATIARRTLQIADPFADMGAMIVRHAVWRVFERVGDGSTTTAVLAYAVAHEAARYIAAGGDPVAVRRGVEQGLVVAVAELRRQARPIDRPADIAGVVAGMVRRPAVADMIGEIVDAVGPDGAILVESAQGIETVHEYLDGVRWNEGYISSFLLKKDESTSTNVLNPRVLVTDYALERAEQLVPTLEVCVAAGERNLLVIAPEVRDSAVGLLVANRERGVLDGALAVRAPSMGTQRLRILEDLAVTTGGRCLSEERGDRLEDVTIADLGQARQVWATRFSFGILGGQCNKAAIRGRIAEAKAELSAVETNDEFTREKIKERIGKLGGTAAVIHVGAATESEQEDLKMRIEAAVRAARSAVEDGVVVGGGAALIACIGALEALCPGGDEAVGVQTLAHALAEPMRAIVHNAGYEPEPILFEARARPGQAFDVTTGVWTTAIADPVAVTITALETAISAAGSALSADVLIRRKGVAPAVNP